MAAIGIPIDANAIRTPINVTDNPLKLKGSLWFCVPIKSNLVGAWELASTGK